MTAFDVLVVGGEIVDGTGNPSYRAALGIRQGRLEILRIPGIAQVDLFGGTDYGMRIWLCPDKMAKLGLTPADVVSAIREQNLQAPAGRVGMRPSPRDQEFTYTVSAPGRLITKDEFANIIVRETETGAQIRVKDVGRVELGAENYNQLLRFNGRDAVGLGIFQLPGSNALEVREGVVAELERLKGNFPPGMVYESAFDTTTAVQASIEEVLQTLAEAIVLVIFVIFIFLHGWRSILVVATTLPVTRATNMGMIRRAGD